MLEIIKMEEYTENWVAEPTSPLGVLAVQYTPVHTSLDPPDFMMELLSYRLYMIEISLQPCPSAEVGMDEKYLLS